MADINTNSPSPSSPESEGKKSPPGLARGEKRKGLGSVVTRGRLQKMKSSPRPRTPPPGTSRNLFFQKLDKDDLTPLQRQGLRQLLEDCVAPRRKPAEADTTSVSEAESTVKEDEEECSMEEHPELKDIETSSCPDDFSPNCSGMFEFSMTSASSGSGRDTSKEGGNSVLMERKVQRYEMLYGPLPANDSIDIFLSRKINDSSIHDVSTAESDADVMAGKASDQDEATNLW